MRFSGCDVHRWYDPPATHVPPAPKEPRRPQPDHRFRRLEAFGARRGGQSTLRVVPCGHVAHNLRGNNHEVYSSTAEDVGG